MNRNVSRTLLGGIALLAIAVATLIPAPGPGGSPMGSCLRCGEYGTADIIGNVLLFIPLGVALGMGGREGHRLYLIPALLAAAIEFAQLLFITGRYATPSDVLFNTLGGASGIALARSSTRWVLNAPSVRDVMALAFAVAASGVLAITGWLFQPSFTHQPLYGQWTANLGMYVWYRGRVLAASIGGGAAPSWRLADSEAARESLLAGGPVDVLFVAGPPPRDLAPIFSVFDRDQREHFLVGADGEDLVLHLRRRAADARLKIPDHRWRGALAGVAEGDTVRVVASRPGDDWCLALSHGASRGAITRDHCGLQFRAANGWGLLLFPRALGERGRRLFDAFWLLCLVLPVAFFVRGSVRGVLAVGLLGAALVLTPPAFGLAVPASADLAGVAVGTVVGRALGQRVRGKVSRP